MKYHPLPSSLYVQNRKNYTERLKPNSIAVFRSNDILPTNADGTLPFRQNNDLLFLSGIDQEETTLLLFPDFPDESMREILFVKETSEHIAIWEGHKFTKQEATELSGIQNVMWAHQFESVLHVLAVEAENIYLNQNEHTRAKVTVETGEARFNKWCQEKYPLYNYERSTPILHDLRKVKAQPEIDALQTACDITDKGFRRLLKFVKPGVMEYEIEAELLHEFVSNRSRGFAYEPIIASGFSSCVLHYIENNKECKDGDILLLDVGAEYANYNADLTRSIPVNGRYTQRQKDIYNAVLRVQKEAFKMLVPGNTIFEYHKEVGKLMESELLGLGLIDTTDIKNQDPKNPAYKKYFMHGTSHYLGLDVHDVGSFYDKLVPGMVFTVEPGIYIREESLGVRIENDVVVTDGEVHDLMKNIPVEVEEIEEIMNS